MAELAILFFVAWNTILQTVWYLDTKVDDSKHKEHGTNEGTNSGTNDEEEEYRDGIGI